jgi:hypothetical protein
MTEEAGTLEQIAEGLANALTELSDVAQPANIVVLLNELGIDNPPDLSGDVQLAQSLRDVAERAMELTPRVDELILAGEEGGTVEIVTAGAAVLSQCAAVGVAIDAVGSRLQAALATVPGGPQLAAELTERVIGDAIARYLDAERPLLRRVLTLATVLEWEIVTPETDESVGVIRRRLHLDRLPKLLSNPLELLGSGYGWGRNDFNASSLLQRISELFEALEPVAAFGDVDGLPVPPVLDFGPFTLMPTATTPPGLAGELFTEVASNSVFTLAHISDEWNVVLRLDGGLSEGLTLQLTPPTRLEFSPPPSGALEGRVILEIEGLAADPSSALFLLGITGASRVEAKSVSVGVEARGSWRAGVQQADMDVGVRAIIKGGRLLISPAGADGFLTTVLPREGMELDFDLEVAWSQARGLRIEGGAGLSISIPIKRSVGPILLESVNITGSVESNALALTAGITVRAGIGPVKMVVEDIGLRLDVDLATRGNTVIANLDVSFNPPKGIGVTIDAGPITGGGFINFDKANGRYSGALQLKIYEISVSAIGILDTKLPNGAEGYSFIILISGEFAPIQLGLGFTLSGVGGLAGIHRTVMVEALQSGIKTHILDSILFPQDPLGNAPRIISDLGTVFPPASGKYVFGPMAIIGWGTPNLIRAELGIILELPDPVRLVILGQITAILPSEDLPLIELHIDTVGVIDFTNKHLSIDSTLHDSRIISFSISGDMALRLDWGENPNFALAIGGFHPDFKPPPGFPALQRISLSIGWWPAELQLQAYFAITSNTLQFGAQVDLYIQEGIFNIKGTLGIDALFIFSPFSFIAGLHGGIALRIGGWNLIGVSLSGQLSGPAPWHATGEACISILFWDICADFDLTWGEEERQELPQTDPWPLLQKAIKDGRNWSAQPAAMAFRVVSLAPPAAGAPDVIVDPVGNLSFHQKVLPLNRRITKFGETKPHGPDRYNLDSVLIGSKEDKTDLEMLQDFFAPAQFEEMSDAERLSRESFAKMDAGIAIHSSSVDAGERFTWTTIDYETHKLIDKGVTEKDKGRYSLKLNLQQSMILKGAAIRSALRTTGFEKFANRERSRVKFEDEEYVVVSIDNLSTVNVSTRPGPMNKDAAYQALYDYLHDHPQEKGKLQVVPKAEVPDSSQKVYA